MLGQFAMSHHDAAVLRRLAGWIAVSTGCALNLLSHGANSVGAWLAGAVPHRGPAGHRCSGGMNKDGMIRSRGKTWLLWNLEPEFDIENPAQAAAALQAAEGVIAVSSFATESLKNLADIILPLAPVAESEGSLVNFDGDTIGFTAAGKLSGEARPGWKILRRLGGELGLEGFGHVDLADLHDEMQATLQAAACAGPSQESSATKGKPPARTAKSVDGLYRVGDVPIYSSDALCRRAPALQQTSHARSDFVGLSPADGSRLGLTVGGKAKVSQGQTSTELEVRISEAVPAGAAWVPSATCSSIQLGSATGPISVEAV